VFVKFDEASRVVELARSLGVDALVAGRIEAGPKQVIVKPLGLRFGAESLALR
jgi:phosphoribosylformylglycinamidine cyclo-ligase